MGDRTQQKLPPGTQNLVGGESIRPPHLGQHRNFSVIRGTAGGREREREIPWLLSPLVPRFPANASCWPNPGRNQLTGASCKQLAEVRPPRMQNKRGRAQSQFTSPTCLLPYNLSFLLINSPFCARKIILTYKLKSFLLLKGWLELAVSWQGNPGLIHWAAVANMGSTASLDSNVY